MKKSSNAGLIVTTLLTSAAIGGALGLLFAPNRGSVTRKKLYSKGKQAKNDLQEKYDALLKSQNSAKEKYKV